MPDIPVQSKFDLEKRLPAGQIQLLRKVAGAAAARRLPLYLVGGFVRDLLLGLPAADFDLVVEGDAIGLARALAAQYGGRVTAHARFGTAQWSLPDPGHRAIDLISARSETYARPGALPTVKPGRLADDMARRDFTINTLALRLDGGHWGELRDDWHGLEDLKQGLVRVLHPRSFLDDPTRLFRLVRYEQRYGLRIAPETLDLIPAACPLVESLSAERLRHELDLILDEEQAAAMLARLSELDVLRFVHPSLAWNAAIRGRFLNGLRLARESTVRPAPAHAGGSFLGWHLWLVGRSSAEIQSAEARLHFHKNLLVSLLAASALFADLSPLDEEGAKPSRCVNRLRDLPLGAVYAVFLSVPEGLARRNLSMYLQIWRHVRPKANGYDLIERGLPEGPRYQQILDRLQQAWLDGEVTTEKEEAELLDSLLA